MAAHTGQSTRSRRFIKIYLGTWGLLAVGALGYLAMLAFPQQADAPPPATVKTAQNDAGDPESGDPSLGEAKSDSQPDSKPLAEAQDSAIHKDAAQPPEAADEHAPREETVQTRLSATEKRPTIGDTPRPSPVPGVTIADNTAGTAATDTLAVKTEAPSGTPHPGGAPATGQGETAAPPSAPATAQPPFVPIETGSIRSPAPAATSAAPSEPPRIVKVAPVRVAPMGVVPETADAAPETRPEARPRPGAKPEPETADAETVNVAPETETKTAETKTASLAPETGRAVPKEEIVFGEPVVTRARREFAVQLAASPSLQALRRSWGEMAEQHAALGGLQPRVIAPGPGSGVYRLLAGPVPSKAEAERICEELAVGPTGCFATNYTGAPL